MGWQHGSQYRPSKPLQCYNDWLYADIRDDNDCCIAPTKEQRQCLWTISPADHAKAQALRKKAEDIEEQSERDKVLADFILLRCCTKQHRWRLEHAPDVLDLLIERYSRDILPPLPQGSPPRNKDTRPLRQGIFDRFVPYETDPLESVATELLYDVPSNYVGKGIVYFFTCPEYSRYAKIGYTGKSAEERLLGWQSCYPSAFLGKQAEFKYPKRIEKLIHLEMAKHRVKIVRCGRCDRTHLEWFHIPVESASRIINDWVELTTREPLYDAKGCLTKPWKKRIKGFKAWKGETEMTARGLLEFLDIEEDLDLVLLQDFMSMLSLTKSDDASAKSKLTVLPLEGDTVATTKIATMSLQDNGAGNVKTQLKEDMLTVKEEEISVEVC